MTLNYINKAIKILDTIILDRVKTGLGSRVAKFPSIAGGRVFCAFGQATK